MAGASTMLGFWIYLMSDCLIFAMLFAVFGVLGSNYAGGPAPQTCSSCRWSRSTPRCCCSRRSPTASPCWRWMPGSRPTQIWLAITGLFGAAFLGIELYEFSHLIARGRDAAAQRLPVGLLHAGRHARPARHLRPDLAGDPDGPGAQRGLIAANQRRLMCLSHVLALPRRHLDRRLHLRLPDGVSCDEHRDTGRCPVTITGPAAHQRTRRRLPALERSGGRSLVFARRARNRGQAILGDGRAILHRCRCRPHIRPVASWPRGGLTVVAFPNSHLQYAITWFVMAALLAFMSVRMALRRPGA
jgi:cytochrome o ubiquinol oxidase subunit 3